MTITIPHESNDHHVRQTAIAVTLVVILTVAGFTFWQGASIGGGTTNASVETAAVETFSPEKARANGPAATVRVETFSPEKARANATATVTQSRAVTTSATEQRQAIESSLPSGARAASIGTATRGNGHPDIQRATGSEPTIPPAAITLTSAASFAASDAPTELKEYALAHSLSDWVVDYDRALQILQDFARVDFSQRSGVQTDAGQGTALDELPANCTYWGVCTPD